MRVPSIKMLRALDPAQVRDAARIALQTSIGALATWLILRSFLPEEAFVGILAAVLIVQPSIGGTMGAAGTRLRASLLGCAIGALGIAVFPPGWSTAAGLLLSMAALNAIATFRPAWTYGIVSAVALSLTDGDAIWAAALDRLIAIGIGAAVGVAVVWSVWPDTAGHRFRRHMRSALRTFADAVDEVASKADVEDADPSITNEDELRSKLNLAREAAEALKLADREPLMRQVDAATELRAALHMLARVVALPRDVGGGAGLGEPILAFRQAVAGQLRQLADGSDIADEGKVTQAQREISRRIETRETGSPREAYTLAFAMDEVDRALADLCRSVRPG